MTHLVIPLLSHRTDGRFRLPETTLAMAPPLFPLLARGKRLRGTFLDPFRLQAERGVERDLIDWYLTLMARCDAAKGTVEWRAILGTAADIRGYGSVKMVTVTRVRDDVEARLRNLNYA